MRKVWSLLLVNNNERNESFLKFHLFRRHLELDYITINWK